MIQPVNPVKVVKPHSFNLVLINCKRDECIKEERYRHAVYVCQNKTGKMKVAEHWFNEVLSKDNVERYRSNPSQFIDDVINERLPS